MDVNEYQKRKLAYKIKEVLGKDLTGKKLAIWGLAFKPNTDDIREAPALYIIDILLKAGAEISAYDPEAMDNVKEIFGDKITFASDQYETLNAADSLIVCTEWSVFRSPDFDKIKSLMNQSMVFDGRNVFDPTMMKNLDIEYYSIGRP
jgi:UDPglucose 6-dehydrogenase